MRDLRKFRNKVTLELDNRQIAFVFSGLLALLIIVFALGVVVGKGLGKISNVEATSAENEAYPTPETIIAEPLEVTQSDIGVEPPTPSDPTQIISPGPVSTPVSSLPVPTSVPEPVEPPSSTPAPAALPGAMPTPPSGSGWTVQLSSHPNEDEALAKQKSWVAKGVQAYVVKADLGSKGIWYRLRVGKFAAKSGADQYASALAAKEGIKPFVTALP